MIGCIKNIAFVSYAVGAVVMIVSILIGSRTVEYASYPFLIAPAILIPIWLFSKSGGFSASTAQTKVASIVLVLSELTTGCIIVRCFF